MIWWVVKGGPVMIPIILGSVLGLALVIDRAFVFMRVSDAKSRGCLQQVLQEVQAGRVAEALSVSQETQQPVATVLQAGLDQWGMPLDVMKEAMEETTQTQVQHLEQRLGALATVVTVEPMLGFLGTITGLIRAFMNWETAGAQVTVSTLAGGIYEAMITTAAGLIIAIPFLMAHNTFVNRIKRIAAQSAEAGYKLLMLYARQHKELSRETTPYTPLYPES